MLEPNGEKTQIWWLNSVLLKSFASTSSELEQSHDTHHATYYLQLHSLYNYIGYMIISY